MQWIISIHFRLLRHILFQLCVIILKISILMKYHNFWSFSTIRKLIYKKNGHFKLQSNFSITFEILAGIKWTNFKNSKSGGERKQNIIMRYSLSLTDAKKKKARNEKLRYSLSITHVYKPKQTKYCYSMSINLKVQHKI